MSARALALAVCLSGCTTPADQPPNAAADPEAVVTQDPASDTSEDPWREVEALLRTGQPLTRDSVRKWLAHLDSLHGRPDRGDHEFYAGVGGVMVTDSVDLDLDGVDDLLVTDCGNGECGTSAGFLARGTTYVPVGDVGVSQLRSFASCPGPSRSAFHVALTTIWRDTAWVTVRAVGPDSVREVGSLRYPVSPHDSSLVRHERDVAGLAAAIRELGPSCRSVEVHLRQILVPASR